MVDREEIAEANGRNPSIDVLSCLGNRYSGSEGDRVDEARGARRKSSDENRRGERWEVQS
jgi:hypothetical protein